MKSNRESELAEKIARLIESESKGSELAALFAAVEKLERRLDKIEAERSDSITSKDHLSLHPSLDRFAVAEAVGAALVDSPSKEKTCTFEPNGRPCDHCAMCGSRGF